MVAPRACALDYHSQRGTRLIPAVRYFAGKSLVGGQQPVIGLPENLWSGLVCRESIPRLSMAFDETTTEFSSTSAERRERSLGGAGGRQSDRPLLSTRFALALGFGGFLAIIALAGVDGIRVLQQINRSDNQIRKQFLLRNHAARSRRLLAAVRCPTRRTSTVLRHCASRCLRRRLIYGWEFSRMIR